MGPDSTKVCIYLADSDEEEEAIFDTQPGKNVKISKELSEWSRGQ